MEWLGDLGSAVLGTAYAFRIPLTMGGVVAVVLFAVVARRRGWVGAVRRHPRRSAAILVPLAAIALPLGWYLGSPLVLSASVDEAPPVVAAASAPAPARSSASGSAVPGSPAVASAVPSPVDPTPTPVPLVDRSGPFHGSDAFHFGRGTARLIETAPGTYVVRLEDFAVRNGPDLYVYLSPDANGYADGAIELGRLKADTGNQNYPVPDGTLSDPSQVASVVIWCKQFSHLFATAPLGP